MGSLCIDYSGVGHYSTNSSPNSLPIYPSSFEPIISEPGTILDGSNHNRPEAFTVEADLGYVLSPSDNDNMVVIDLALNANETSFLTLMLSIAIQIKQRTQLYH